MNVNIPKKLFAALACCGLLIGAGGAHADDDDWDGHRGRGHYKHYKHKHHRHYHHDHHHTVVRERVIVRERPRYYEEREVHHHYHEAPVRSYSYSRSPAIVVGVDIPPLVIPLR